MIQFTKSLTSCSSIRPKTGAVTDTKTSAMTRAKKSFKPLGLCSLLILAPLLLVTSNARAEWIGLMLLRNALFDHVHVTIAKDLDFKGATQLNIWNSKPLTSMSLEKETNAATQFVLFHQDGVMKEDLTSSWSDFFLANQRKATLLGKNCAWASQYFFNHILNLAMPEHSLTFARNFLFIWAPNFGHGTPLGDAVRLRLIQKLRRDKIPFFTQRDGRGTALQEKLITSLN